MHNLRILLVMLALFLIGGHASAQDAVVVGGDTYISGTNASLNAAAGRDAFLSGFAVDVTQRVEKDVGAAGFDVDVRTPVGGDAYLSGFSIDIDGAITEDLTAAGFNIQVRKSATIGGNARLAAGTVTVDGPIAGSLVATAGTLALNAPIGGDARFVVGTMTFGTDAKITGKLTYSAAKQIAIPTSVIDPARVTFQQLTTKEGVDKARDAVKETVPFVWWTIGGAVFTFAITIAFLVALAAALLAFMPERMERLRLEAMRTPVKVTALGVLGLSVLIGLIPVSAMTLIGIPLIPFAILAAIVFWVLGYIIGAYALTTRMLEAFRDSSSSMGARLLALATGFIVLALLNFIPVLGWLINIAVVFLGLGSIVLRAIRTIAHEETVPAVIASAEPAQSPPPVPSVRRSRK